MCLNNEEMIYRPFRICKVIIFFLKILEMLLTIVLGMAIKQNSIDGIIVSLILASIGFILIKYLYNLVKVILIFNKECVSVLNVSRGIRYDILWKEIPYGYYCRDWHGNLYLVLSPRTMEKKTVKKIVNQYTNSLKFNIYIDECIVIVIAGKKQMEQIEKVVHNNIMILKRI